MQANEQNQVQASIMIPAEAINSPIIQPMIAEETLISQKSSFYHFISVIFDELTHLNINSDIFFFIQALIVFVQILSANWYSFLPEIWDKSTIFGKIILGINCLLMLNSTNDPQTVPYAQILIPFIWNLFIIVFTLSLYLVLKNSGTIKKPVSYLSFFVYQFMIYVGFFPTIAAFGLTFKFLVQKNSFAITFFILYLFIIAFLIMVLYIVGKLLNFCTNPTISKVANYNGLHTFFLFLSNGITMILANMASLFQKWFYAIAFLAHIAFMIYHIFNLFSFPLVKISFLNGFSAFCSATISTDIIALISIFSNLISHMVLFLVPIGVFLVGLVVFYFIFKVYIANITKLFHPENLETDIYDYIQDFPCDSVQKALAFIRIGFSQLQPFVLDGSLGQVLATRFKSFDLWMLTTNLVAFFPSLKLQLNDGITNLKSMFSKSIIDNIMIDRLIKIEQSRAMVSTNEINSVIREMEIKTSEPLNLIKQFWNEISNHDDRATLSSIHEISTALADAKHSWDEILLLYPNESKLADEYANFLIECYGKFEAGIIWKLKSSHLEKGMISGLDKLFQSFVISMPRIWYDKIVDRLGNLHLSHSNEAPNYTISTTTNAQDKLEEDLEAGMLEKTAYQIFQWPQLRMSLTRATSHYRPKGLNIFRIFKYIAFLLWIVLLLVATVYYSSTFDDFIVSYTRMELLNEIRLSLSVLRNLIFLNFAKHKGILYTEQEYQSALPKSALEEQLQYNYINFSQSFKEWSDDCLDSLMELYYTFSDSGLSGVNVTRIVTAFLAKSFHKVQIIETDESSTASEKSAIISLLWYYDSCSDMNGEVYDNLINSSVFSKTALLHLKYSTLSDEVMQDFALQAQENMMVVQNFIRQLIIIVNVLTIVICLPFLYIPIIIMLIDSNRLLHALKFVKPDGAKAASKQISLKSEQNIDLSAVVKSHSTSAIIIGFFILYSFLFIVVIVLTSVAYALLKSDGYFLGELVDLSRYGTNRNSLVSEIFGYVLMCTLASLTNDQSSLLQEILPDIERSYETASTLLSTYHSYFFRGYNNTEGVYTISPELRDFHNDDKCDNTGSQVNMHSYYSCISLDRLISTFILYSSYFADDPTYTLKGENFINLQHMSTAELFRDTKTSRIMMKDIVINTSSGSENNSMILLIIALLIIIINIFINYHLEKKLMLSLKSIMILIRHLPPPFVADTQELIDVLLVKKEETKEAIFDPYQIIFNTTETPIICVGDGFIIETINKSFRNAFHYSNDQLLGRKLTSLIIQPENNDKERTIEEQGAVKLYEKMELMLEQNEDMQCSYPINCICGDEQVVSTSVNAFPVHDKLNHINNFLLLIDDRRESSEIELKLESTRRENATLMSQLIPHDVGIFMADKNEDYVFSCNCSTAISIQIFNSIELQNENNDKLDDIFVQIENISKNYPSILKIKTLFDSLFFVSGLFSTDKDEYPNNASNAIEFAKQARDEILNLLPQSDKSIVEISIISGGPLICGLEGDKYKYFDVIGQMINQLLELQSVTPPNKILITESTKILLADNNDIINFNELENGPMFLDDKTYML